MLYTTYVDTVKIETTPYCIDKIWEGATTSFGQSYLVFWDPVFRASLFATLRSNQTSIAKAFDYAVL